MPSTSIVSGILLMIIGVTGYVFSVINNNHAPTAMIPAAFGALLTLLGVFARLKEPLRKHLMHAAVLIGLLGFIVSAGRLASQINNLQISLAVFSLTAMALICLVFVILCVKSFIDARKTRAA